MNYKSSSELKALSRGQLLGKYNVVIVASLLVAVITTTISLFATSFIGTNGIMDFVLGLIVSFAVDIFAGIFFVGLIYMNLNIICNLPYTISNIYYGFHFHTNKIITIKFILGILELLASLPFTIGVYLMQLEFSYNILAFCLFAFIPACLITVLIELYFSMSFYLLLDFPDYSVRELLTFSVHIMKGHVGQLFYIAVSFIPLFLVCILSCGLGFLWIMPYYRMTLTNFYLDIVQQKTPEHLDS